MLQFVLKRLAILIPTFIGVSLVAFSLIRLVPGDPVMLMLGERGAAPEVYQQMKVNLGLDQPLVTQYFKFLGNAVHGNFGISVVSKLPVIEEFWSRFPATFELGVVAMLWAIALGIPLGILAAIKRNSFLDYS